MNGPSAGSLKIKQFRAVINGSNVLRNKNEEKANKTLWNWQASAYVFNEFDRHPVRQYQLNKYGSPALNSSS